TSTPLLIMPSTKLSMPSWTTWNERGQTCSPHCRPAISQYGSEHILPKVSGESWMSVGRMCLAESAISAITGGVRRRENRHPGRRSLRNGVGCPFGTSRRRRDADHSWSTRRVLAGTRSDYYWLGGLHSPSPRDH